MFRSLARAFGRPRRATAPQGTEERCWNPPAPQEPVAIIGDVHGRADLLEALLARLAEEDAAAVPVFVGDLIDRGEDSAAVLERVRGLARARVLLGNHEEMMLRFLDDPQGGAAWLRHGGMQTLASYGVAVSGARPEAGARAQIRDALRAALGEGTEAWLRGLPRAWQSGNLLVTHAGADPRRPLPLQEPQALTWGHEDFGRRPRTDGLWVAHGHVIVERARVEAGVISVDTGAFATGRLSAVVITPAGARVLEIEARRR
ncbi:metallophosphoesterase [Rhodobacter xanthinilyticus]|uniref:metallophosphoesterase n=1 Tax=Rhodobacter xanthinilyticus TaxID=1850250 RepID=UPI0009F45685|nr:metallophosphoesterase [Rhodobacter xanthinilyticus]